MADDLEKTEEPTSKKIEDARKEGNVPKSMDVSGFATLFVAVIAVISFFSFIVERIEKLYRYYYSHIGKEITINSTILITINSVRELALMIMPIALLVATAGVIASLMQFGILFTTKPLTPDIKKIDPIKGIKNLFSIKKLIDAIKIILKVTLVFVIAFYFLIKFVKELPTVVNLFLYDQVSWLVEKLMILAFVMLILFFILALVDLIITRYQYFKGLRMSKQEVKDEFKQMEGDPQIKSRIRKLQMELSQKRMMQEIPSADVVITNPTHYAVAIRYEKTKESAPKVIAKGVDFLALKIKEIARANLVQVVENPPLARELYKKCEINDQIPESLYKAVAEVLAYVYKSSGKKM
jgi:flagellar biosynthetic protein FlhB